MCATRRLSADIPFTWAANADLANIDHHAPSLSHSIVMHFGMANDDIVTMNTTLRLL